MKPETRRALIRLANRDGFNSTEVEALLEFSEYMILISGETEDRHAATVLIGMWKESFDESAEP